MTYSGEQGIQYNNEERRDWTQEEGSEKPAETRAALALSQAGVDQSQRAPPDDITSVRFHAVSSIRREHDSF